MVVPTGPQTRLDEIGELSCDKPDQYGKPRNGPTSEQNGNDKKMEEFQQREYSIKCLQFAVLTKE